MSAKLKQDVLCRLSQLKQERNSYDGHWKSIARLLSPRSTRFLSSECNKGTRSGQDIYDNTAPFALRVLVSGMMAGLTSPARPWFRLSVSNAQAAESDAVKRWLFDVENTMREVFSSSNIYQALPIIYHQLAAFGVGAQLLMEDDQDVIRFYPLPVGSFYLGTDSGGRVNTLIREYSMTVSQLVDEFGKENVSDQVRLAYDNKHFDEWIDVVHAIQPNRGRNPELKDNRNLPYISARFELADGDSGRMLDCGGFRDFPAQAPRWEVTGEDVYGSCCPGMISLSDNQMLQSAVKLFDKIVNKIADPPLIADAMLRNQRISMLPGAITYISGLSQAAGAGARPMQDVPPATLAPLAEKIQALQAQINKAFYADMMQMFATSDISNMTAREVEERHQEKLLILGPVMERMNEELLSPIIHRTYRIMESRKLIPPLPEELRGQPINIEYVSIMASAQKMIGTAAIQQLMGFVGNIAAIRPDILDKIDFDHSVDEMAGMLGTSPKVVLSDDVVAKIRAERAQQQQQQQQLEQLAQAAPAMQQGAQAARLLSETGVGDSSALNRILGI
jgi:hypothetical protein